MHAVAVAVPLHACSGRSRPQKATGVNNQRKHTQNIALRTRDRTQGCIAAYPSEFSFAAFFFLFLCSQKCKTK